MEIAERPSRERGTLRAVSAPGPCRGVLKRSSATAASWPPARRGGEDPRDGSQEHLKKRIGQPKGDEAMQVKIFPRSALVGREALAERAQEVLRQNDMGGGRGQPRASTPTSGVGTAASPP